MFRFTIRDVLWLMVVAAALLAWRLEINRNNRNEARLAAIEANLRAMQVPTNQPTPPLAMNPQSAKPPDFAIPPSWKRVEPSETWKRVTP